MTRLNNNRAFSLIEILIVIFVIAMGFMGVISMVKSFIVLNYANKNSLLAVVLAQNGMELTRNLRDTDWLNGFDNFTYNICSDGDYDDIPADGHQSLLVFDDRALASSGNIIDLAGAAEGNLTLGQAAKSDKSLIYINTNTSDHKFYYRRDICDSEYKCQKTAFRRVIETVYHRNNTDDDREDDYLTVNVHIYWQDRGVDRSYTLTENLHNYALAF